MTTQDPKNLALKIRRHVVKMVHACRGSHIASSLSIADILAVLYGSTMNISSDDPQAETRDRFILSKGHAAAALYAALAESSFFPVEQLSTYAMEGSTLLGHASHEVPGVELSTGALGHGLPVGAGLALAAKRGGSGYRSFVLMSDGEMDEGSNWEAALFGAHHKLNNLIAIIDYNKIQSFGRVSDVLGLEPLADKWRAFGWAVMELDGHDVDALEKAFSRLQQEAEKPSVIIAHTVKGKGVSFMEDDLAWHYKPPNDDQLVEALRELGGSA